MSAGTVRGSNIRRLWHLLGGSVFPLLAFFVSREQLLLAAASTCAVFLAADTVRLAVPAINRWALAHLGGILRQREHNCLTGSSYLLLATVAAFILLPLDIAAAALLFLAVGDAAAGAVGERFHRMRLFGKSLEGTMAFLLAAVAVGVVLVLAGLGLPLWLVIAGAAVGALVELLPVPVDDNLSVPLLSGAAMAVL